MAKPHEVVVLGFGSCAEQARIVHEDLSEYYKEEVEVFSFWRANDQPEALRRAVKGSRLTTHSAGMPTIVGTSPHEIHAIAPPLPAFAPTLMARAALSGLDLLASKCETSGEKDRIVTCSGNLTREVLTHPAAHLGKLGVIAAFNAIDVATSAQRAGIATELSFMDSDRLFVPTAHQLLKARAEGISVYRLTGGHERFVYDAAGVMQEFHGQPDPFTVGSEASESRWRWPVRGVRQKQTG